ncbi:hypothetical protein QJS10_CPB17g00744 [Acorus calamus]|uniref:TFG box profile domain-containing protein n=1 Tax=Acorus calamus TaxID=4465 RepID=A0AAV9CW74_ACOCL|nr:hypothetical protein QJS10_CPB17g00744 [Acorus calamus]
MEPVVGYSTRPSQFTQTARSGFRNDGFRGGRRGGGGGRGYGRSEYINRGNLSGRLPTTASRGGKAN